MTFNNIKIFLMAALLLTTASSCLTRALWENKFYQEEIKQIYVNGDAGYVVLIGQNYHYVFNDHSKVLRQIIDLRNRSLIGFNSEQTKIKLENYNNLSGQIVFSGPFTFLSNSDKSMLRRLGFAPNQEDDIVIKINFSGRRYLQKYIGNQSKNKELNKIINIYYDDSSFIKNGAKAAITPITLTLDAALFIGKVALSSFGKE